MTTTTDDKGTATTTVKEVIEYDADGTVKVELQDTTVTIATDDGQTVEKSVSDLTVQEKQQVVQSQRVQQEMEEHRNTIEKKAKENSGVRKALSKIFAPLSSAKSRSIKEVLKTKLNALVTKGKLGAETANMILRLTDTVKGKKSSGAPKSGTPKGAWLPELWVKKTGTSSGPDLVFGTNDDSTTAATPGEIIQYVLEYGNNTSGVPDYPYLTDSVPEGTCLIPRSFGFQDGLWFSEDDRNTWYPSPDFTNSTWVLFQL